MTFLQYYDTQINIYRDTSYKISCSGNIQMFVTTKYINFNSDHLTMYQLTNSLGEMATVL